MDYIYVDNSNLYIEGRRVSVVASGLALRSAGDLHVRRHNLKILVSPTIQ